MPRFQQAKPKPKKDSLVQFIKIYTHIDNCIKFFFNIKFPDGFHCDCCPCDEYYIIKRKNVKSGYIIQCKECGKQHSLLAGTIFQDTSIPLFNLLLVLFLFFTSNKGITATEIANHAEISYHTARKLLRKCRILMAESNNEKILESEFYEIDFIEVGGKKEGKPGKGADKQPVLMILSTDKLNKYPQYVKYHIVDDYTGQPVEEYLKNHCVLSHDKVISCDKDKAFMRLEKVVNLENSKVDYDDKDHKLYWLNIFAGNFQNNLKTIYHGVSKRDLPYFLSEQEWRTNHRKTGKHIMEKVAKYISKSSVITHQSIVKALDIYSNMSVPIN